MSITIRKLGCWIGLWMAIIGTSPWTPFISAADPAFVGVLATAIEPSTVKQLGLTDNQVQSLMQVIKQREDGALSFAQKIRELPPDEKDARKRDFVRESEKEGYALLTIEQRSKLEQIRLAKLGLPSLIDEEVAQALGLSEGQSKQVREILGSRRAIIAEVGAEKAAATMELRLKSVLTMVQFKTWETLAGLQTRATTNPVASVAKGTEPEVGKATVDVIERGNAPKASDSVDLRESLQINFNKTPWEAVLQWLCKEAELTLVTNVYPQGTFTYADQYRRYSIAQAIDVMNGVLLKEGWTLMRINRAVMLVDLSGEAEVVRGWLREISALVNPADLREVGEFEICKSLFVLSRLTAEEAKKEIEKLIGLQGSVIALPSAGQVMVCETGGKLRLIDEWLRRVEDPETAPGAKVISITLNHVSAEEVLAVVRPLVGLPADTNTSTEINVSTDTFGNTLYASGKPEKLQVLREMTKKIDVAPSEANKEKPSIDSPYFKSHRILGSDPDESLGVLQTLLANVPNLRMSKDPKTNRIIAWATKSDHEFIEKTLVELSGESANFNIIPLRRIDPASAIATLERIFGKKSDKDTSSTIPTILGDPAARSLMVQGTPDQLTQIRAIVDKLEESGPQTGFGDKIRVLQGVSGPQAERLMNSVKDIWVLGGKSNPIRQIIPPQKEKTDRRVPPKSDANDRNDAKDEGKQPANRETSMAIPQRGFSPLLMGISSIWLTGLLIQEGSPQTPAKDATQSTTESKQAEAPKKNVEEDGQKQTITTPSGKEIVVIQGPTGLIVTSEDQEALAEFEQIARMVSDQLALAPPTPATIYLRHIKAQDASVLLKSMLTGETSSGGSGGGILGSLAGNVMGELGGGMFRGLLGGSSTGSSSTTTGASPGKPLIIPDPRLNALHVTATPLEMQVIEQLIEIIDQEDSPVENETRGTPQRIPVYHNDVEEIAKVVKELFKDRLSTGDAGGGGGGQRQPNPAEFLAALQGRGGRGGAAGGGQPQLKEATMSIATDAKSNSLFVLAPPNLFEQVKSVVEMLDEAGEEQQEDTIVYKLGGELNPVAVQRSIQAIFGAQVKTTPPAQTATTGATTGTNNQQRQGGRGNNPFGGQGFGGFGGFGQGFGGFGQGGRGTGGQGQGGQGQGGRGQGGGRQGGGGRTGGGGNRGGFQ